MSNSLRVAAQEQMPEPLLPELEQLEVVSAHTIPPSQTLNLSGESSTLSQNQNQAKTTSKLNHDKKTNHSNDKDAMVAGLFDASGTPPESPLTRSGGTQKLHISLQPQTSPKKISMDQHSPSRPPSSSLMMNLSDRLQPATATAPVVGRHHKESHSLVGFDPLLVNETTASNSPTDGVTDDLVATLFPATDTTNIISSPKNPAEAEAKLHEELQKLTHQVAAVSPITPEKNKSKGLVSKPIFGRGTSLTPKWTPPFRSSHHSPSDDTTKTTTTTKATTKAKRPWQRHRRTQSLETPDNIMRGMMAAATTTGTGSGVPPLLERRVESFDPSDTKNNHHGGLVPPPLPFPANTSNNGGGQPTTTILTNESLLDINSNSNSNNKRASTGSTTIPSPMIQDLYDVVKAQAAAGTKQGEEEEKEQQQQKHTKPHHRKQSPSLSMPLPSLARPSATSFLTGQEIVRSSEQDPSPFQLELPSIEDTLVAARLVQFVEQYRKEDMNLDLNLSLVGLSRSTMQSFVMDEDTTTNTNNNSGAVVPAHLTEAHRPVVESLLEAADDVTVLGYYATEQAESADARREAVLLERQLQIVVVFRGTTPEQTAKSSFFKKNHHHALETLDTDASQAECKIYASIKEAYMELEGRVLAGLDKHMDENPFCNVVFTGQSTGGAMATLAAYRYATNRPMSRVSCVTFGSPKVGDRVFRQQANSLPNLKIFRIENANDSKCLAPDATQGSHAGHSIVLSKTHDGNNNGLVAVAYKFDDDHDARKQRSSKHNILAAAFKKERDISSYVSTLEQIYQAKPRQWPTDYKGEDGTGVRGKDNEQRQVV